MFHKKKKKKDVIRMFQQKNDYDNKIYAEMIILEEVIETDRGVSEAGNFSNDRPTHLIYILKRFYMKQKKTTKISQ